MIPARQDIFLNRQETPPAKSLLTYISIKIEQNFKEKKKNDCGLKRERGNFGILNLD